MNGNDLFHTFQEIFGTSPVCLIHAPGRVNLIGEHTDYNGLPVLPIAISSTIKVFVSPRRDDTVAIQNMLSSYEPLVFELGRKIIPSPQGHWANYVKAAVEILVQHFDGNLHGMNALFDGDIPKAAGLSSSSALVISSALSLLASNGITMDPIKLAELMAVGERYVGTQGGGMDQAVCLLGRSGNAVKLDFFPLRHTYIPFPENHSVIVAHSLIFASKTKNALLNYNSRPAECRLATAFINSLYKLALPIKRLGDVIRHDFFRTHSSIEDFIFKTFSLETYTLRELADCTGETVESLSTKYLAVGAGKVLPEPAEGFRLRQRVLHLLTEGRRVEKSCEALLNGDTVQFGELMNASHESCDRDYAISTPELNTLAYIMRESGALGARLTGAGFGGCAIALVRDKDIRTVKESIIKKYYGKYIVSHHPGLLKKMPIDDTVIFNVKPSQGAKIQHF